MQDDYTTAKRASQKSGKGGMYGNLLYSPLLPMWRENKHVANEKKNLHRFDVEPPGDNHNTCGNINATFCLAELCTYSSHDRDHTMTMTTKPSSS